MRRSVKRCFADPESVDDENMTAKEVIVIIEKAVVSLE